MHTEILFYCLLVGVRQSFRTYQGAMTKDSQRKLIFECMH